MAVVAFHAFPSVVPGGFIGVDVFFVISGYLISTLLLESLEAGTFGFSEFYARRIKRLFPALLLVMTTCYVLGRVILFPDEFAQLTKHIAGGAGFVSNFVLWHEAGYFDTAAETKPLLHLWSLGIEEQFYLLWPVLLWFAWKQKISPWTIPVTIAIGSFVLNLVFVSQDVTSAFYSPQTRFWELACGCLLACATLYRKTSLESLLLRRGFANAASIFGLCLLVLGFWRINSTLLFPGYWALIPVFGALLLIAAGPNAKLNQRVLSSRPAVWLGLVSYPLYLWHWPLLSFARIIENETPSLAVRGTALVFSLVLAAVTYRFVETPIRHGRSSAPKVAFLILLMIVLGSGGLYSSMRAEPAGPQAGQVVSYSFPQTAECIAEFPHASSCYASAKKYPESIALVGDSHMEALTYGFKHLFETGALPFNVYALGRAGCNPFIDTDSITFEKKSFGCTDALTPTIRAVLKRPDIKWVILAGRHAARYSGTAYGEIEREFAAKPWTYQFSANGVQSSSNEEAFAFGLQATLDEIKRSGKRVIFVHQLPELGFNPKGCLRSFGGKSLKQCAIDLSEVHRRLDPYKATVNQIIENRSDVQQYDPMHLVCDEHICSPFAKDGMLFYRDDDHMSPQGAQVMAKEIAGSLASLPRGRDQ